MTIIDHPAAKLDPQTHASAAAGPLLYSGYLCLLSDSLDDIEALRIATENRVRALTRNEAQGNGGGVETLHSRKTWLVHPAGYAFKSATVTGLSPTMAELALPANWERVYAERKQLPFAFLVTNG